MQVTAQQLIDDPYGTCCMYNADPETQTAADQLFCRASLRLAGFLIYGDIKPPKEVIINDVWNFFTPEERQIMQDADHPFYQAWLTTQGE